MSREERVQTEDVRYVATELDNSIEVRKVHDPLRRLTRAEAEECARRANALPAVEARLKEAEELLERLSESMRIVRSKVMFSIEHSIRACAHQDFLADDQCDLRQFDKGITDARAFLDKVSP